MKKEIKNNEKVQIQKCDLCIYVNKVCPYGYKKGKTYECFECNAPKKINP